MREALHEKAERRQRRRHQDDLPLFDEKLDYRLFERGVFTSSGPHLKDLRRSGSV